jgi:hypothetical protein
VPRHDDQPLTGVFRVVYFLATAVVTLMLVLSAIAAFYDGPDEGTGGDFGFGLEEAVSDTSQDNYNRNVSLILTVVSAGLFATSILGLGSRFNPLRAGLLLGGLLVYITGMGFWASSSDQWIGFFTSLVSFAVLGVGFLYLEEGIPLGAPTEVRRIEIPATSAANPTPATAAPPPTPPPPPLFTPPPRAMPPDEPTSSTHEPEVPPGDRPGPTD